MPRHSDWKRPTQKLCPRVRPSRQCLSGSRESPTPATNPDASRRPLLSESGIGPNASLAARHAIHAKRIAPPTGRCSARCRSHRGDSRNRAIEYRRDKQGGAQHTHNDGQAVQAVIARSFAI